MIQETKVSVIMLTYNQEKFVDEAIRSVILQKTNFHYELIIGDDASSDKTVERCKEWKMKYPEIVRLVDRKKNIGLIDNFIDIYNSCKGQYIAICEGDDFWTDCNKLQKQVDFLDTNKDYSMCFHRVINYYADKGTKSLSNRNQKIDTDIYDLAKSNYITNVSIMFRKGLFGSLPEWFREVTTYDYAIHMLNAQFGKIHYMPRPMAVYRQHSKSIWSINKADIKLNIGLKVRELLIEHFRNTEPKVCHLLLDAHTRFSLNAAYQYRIKKHYDLADKVIERILKIRPELTKCEIERRLDSLKPGFNDIVKIKLLSLMKKTRAAVSFFIPIPHIKQ